MLRWVALLLGPAVALAGCVRAGPAAAPSPVPTPAPAASATAAGEAGRAAENALARAGDPSHPESEDSAAADPEAADAPAWLGVELGMREPEEPGVRVRSVMSASPAERAGLRIDDVILTIDGKNVARPSEVIAEVTGHKPGQRIAITYSRAGAERLAAATLEAVPNEEALMRKRYVNAPAPALGDLQPVQGSVDPNLRSLRGKVVLIEFWATWCVPCRMTAPLLSQWSAVHGAEGLTVMGVTSDPVDLALHGAQEASMSYALFSDSSGATIRGYRAFALPTLFVIDRRGVVRDVMVGLSSERLREIDRLVFQLLAER